MIRYYIFSLIALLLLTASCSKSIEANDLYGTWNYVSVASFNPPDSITKQELELQSPAIIFSEGNVLKIEWGAKLISHGTYIMDGKMIRYTETLPGGTKRDFPFLIKELNENVLVFETMEQSYTRVKAIKKPTNN